MFVESRLHCAYLIPLHHICPSVLNFDSLRTPCQSSSAINKLYSITSDSLMMIKIFIIPSQFMAWQPVILEYLNQCLRLTTFGEKHRTTLVDMYFHLMTLNMEFSEVPIFFFFMPVTQ